MTTNALTPTPSRRARERPRSVGGNQSPHPGPLPQDEGAIQASDRRAACGAQRQREWPNEIAVIEEGNSETRPSGEAAG